MNLVISELSGSDICKSNSQSKLDIYLFREFQLFYARLKSIFSPFFLISKKHFVYVPFDKLHRFDPYIFISDIS